MNPWGPNFKCILADHPNVINELDKQFMVILVSATKTILGTRVNVFSFLKDVFSKHISDYLQIRKLHMPFNLDKKMVHMPFN